MAHESGHREVQLTVGIYQMSERNTPGVGRILSAAQMPFVPEAHCYLTVHGERLDFTGLSAGQSSPFELLMAEHFIAPGELPHIKVTLHKEFISQWARAQGFSADGIWRVREACIAALSADERKA